MCAKSKWYVNTVWKKGGRRTKERNFCGRPTKLERMWCDFLLFFPSLPPSFLSLKAKKVMLLQFPKDKWKVSYYSSLVFHQIGKWKTFFSLPFLVRSCSSKGSVLQLSERSFGARHASLSFRKGNEKSFLLKFASVIDLFSPFPFSNLIMKRIPELKIQKKKFYFVELFKRQL